MKKIKIVTVVGTRPEIIRLSSIIKKLNESKIFEHILIHTGQNYDYELNQIFFDDLKIQEPDFFLNCAGNSAISTVGNILIKIESILLELQPSAFLVLGDTNSCLSAIAARKLKIPIFHMEAGNRCFDLRVPEESNRKIVDHISDINLCYSDIARNYLIDEGLKKDQIITTGSPMFEVLGTHLESINFSKILKKLDLKMDEYFLVSAHREENVTSKKDLSQLINSLNSLALLYGFPIIFSTHPRTKNMIEKFKLKTENLIVFSKPFGFFDYVNLQVNSLVTLSDSGTISEESSILNFRALNLRVSHERPEAFEEASVPLVGTCEDRIIQGVKLVLNQKKGIERNFNLVKDYSSNNVSLKVERIIFSYINFIKKRNWDE